MTYAKRLLKRSIVQLGRRFAWCSRGRIVVLCYHSVHPCKVFSSATPRLFEQQLQWLKSECVLTSFEKILHCTSMRDMTKPIVAITFDDGYGDNFEYAYPLLNKHGISATFFLTAGLIERDPRVVERFQMLRRSRYEDIRPLEWSQVREMCEGGMEVGGHTYSHPNLVRLGTDDLQVELRYSKDLIEDRTGVAVTGMAYPFGKPRRHFTDETTHAVQDVGYQYAGAVLFRSVRASDSHYEIPRFFVQNDDISTLRDKVFGAWDLLGLWQQQAPLWAARMISAADFIE